jgi:hypothetical protein
MPNHYECKGEMMKIGIPGKYTAASFLLLLMAATFITIAVITNREDITTAALVISGMVCALTGIFVLTFSGDEPIDPRLIGLIPAQGSINLCSITQHLGFHGNAYFLPPSVTGETSVVQFNPISIYDGKEGSLKGSFREKGPAGIVTYTSCGLLIQDLKKRDALVVPNKEEELTYLIRETIEDDLKFAPKVSAVWLGDKVTITFHKYPFFESCEVMMQKSSHCCSISPCPACSLCGALIAEGRDMVVKLDRCSLNSSSRDVKVIFSILPLLDSNP